MRTNLAKLYYNLTAEERFRVLMAAISRDDREEAMQLHNTCPRKTYLMHDVAYTSRIDASRDIVFYFAIDWLENERTLLICKLAIKAYRDLLKGYAQAYQNAAGVDIFRFEIDKEIPEELKIPYHRAKVDLKTAKVAMITFAEKIGLNIEHFLAWFPPLLDWMKAVEGDIADAEVDEGLLRRMLAIVYAYWGRETGDVLSNDTELELTSSWEVV